MNSKSLDSNDEQFLLEQRRAIKRTIREERGQSNWLKNLQSCLGQVTVAVPDVPCSEQLEVYAEQALSQRVNPQFKCGCLDPKELRKVHSILPCSVLPDIHKIKQHLGLNHLSDLDVLLFQIKSYSSMSSFFQRMRD